MLKRPDCKSSSFISYQYTTWVEGRVREYVEGKGGGLFWTGWRGSIEWRNEKVSSKE